MRKYPLLVAQKRKHIIVLPVGCQENFNVLPGPSHALLKERPCTSTRKASEAGDESILGNKSFRVPAENFSQTSPHVSNPSHAASTVNVKGPWAAPGHAVAGSGKVGKVAEGKSKSCLVGDAVLRTPEENLLSEALKVMGAMEASF